MVVGFNSMNLDLLAIMFWGSVRDPIFWIVGAIFGWDIERELSKSVWFFVGAGAVWGGIRVAIYLGLGEELGLAGTIGMVGICVGLMCSLGLTVRAIRLINVRS